VSTIVHVETSDIPTEIETRGGVPDSDIEHLSERLGKILRPVASRTVQCRALMSIHHERDPAAQARVRVTIHSKGETIRSEVIAPSIRDAIAGVESRLHRQLEHRAKRAKDDPRGKPPAPGEWRHGNQPTPKRAGFDRPVGDREIITRKSPTTPRSTLDEARWDRFVLDYDFFLFVDTMTERDMLLTTLDDDEVILDVSDAPIMSVDEATAWFEETGRDFHFFLNEANDRGAVIYRRYDGHYGLLTPSNINQE